MKIISFSVQLTEYIIRNVLIIIYITGVHFAHMYCKTYKYFPLL